jgi:hypothetical protein
MNEKPGAAAKPVAAFILSLLAGLWMLVGPGTVHMAGGPWNHTGYMRGWVSHHSMMTRVAGGAWWPWLGIAAGIVVLMGAVVLYVRPEQRRGWGTAIIAAAAANALVGMGGVLPGIVGVIGGILALTWRPGEPRAPSV